MKEKDCANTCEVCQFWAKKYAELQNENVRLSKLCGDKKYQQNKVMTWEIWNSAIKNINDCFWTIETADFYDDNYTNDMKIQALSQMVQMLDNLNKELQKKYADYCLDVLHADIKIQELKEQTNEK